MFEYVKVSDVDTYASNVINWSELDTSEKERHVYVANVYLNTQRLTGIAPDAVPAPVIRAGCELALMDTTDGIYQDDTAEVTSESVKLGSLSVSTSYNASTSTTSSQNSSQLNFVSALLKPYIASGQVVHITRGW